MKKDEKNTKNTQILSFSMENIEIPQLTEREYSGKKWYYWGKDNKLPFYLYGLYEKSSLMQSIINTTVNFVVGNDIESAIKPNENETWEDLIKNLSLDYILYGGFALQVFYNRAGQIKELGWLDMRKCRTDEEHHKVYYSKEFGTKSSPKYIELPVWKRGEEYRNCSAVFFYTAGKRTVYPLPRYSGSIPAIETSIRIDNFHLNAIRNNFNGNFVLNFNNGIPADDVKKELEKQVRDKFCGDENAGKFLLVFNESKDNGVTVERIQDDQFDKKYEALKNQTITSIFTGFSAPQQLFGYALTGNVFNKNEYQEAFDLYSRLQILPIQNLFKRVFETIYGVEDIIKFIPFELSVEDNDENVEETPETAPEETTKINPETNE